jgi:uncharacterized membrane protein
MVRSKSRIVAFCGVLAATYVVATVSLSPISYMIFNIRVADILKGVVPFLGYPGILALMAGNLVANMFSPLGVLDLFSWGPVGLGMLCIYAFRRKSLLLGCILNAIVVALWVAFLLYSFFHGDYLAWVLVLIPQMMISDAILPYILARSLKKYGLVMKS